MDDIEKKEEQEDLASQWANMLENQEEKEDNQEDLANQWANMLENQEKKDNQEDLASKWANMLENQEKKDVIKETVETESKPEIKPEILKKLDVLLDLPVHISVEIGSKILSIEEILKLTPNSVIDLDRYLNEPIDLKVNGVLIARGELYQIEDNFAIRITEILTKEERANLLTKQAGR